MSISKSLVLIRFKDVTAVEREFVARVHAGNLLEIVRFVEQFESGCGSVVTGIEVINGAKY